MRTRLPPASSVLLVLSLLGIALGAVLRWGADEPDAANLIWGVTTAIGLVPIAWEVLSGIAHKQAGVDLIESSRWPVRSCSANTSPAL